MKDRGFTVYQTAAQQRSSINIYVAGDCLRCDYMQIATATASTITVNNVIVVMDNQSCHAGVKATPQMSFI
jgi:thioredoxin reductase